MGGHTASQKPLVSRPLKGQEELTGTCRDKNRVRQRDRPARSSGSDPGGGLWATVPPQQPGRTALPHGPA